MAAITGHGRPEQGSAGLPTRPILFCVQNLLAILKPEKSVHMEGPPKKVVIGKLGPFTGQKDLPGWNDTIEMEEGRHSSSKVNSKLRACRQEPH
jgi:hypothetical protein